MKNVARITMILGGAVVMLSAPLTASAHAPDKSKTTCKSTKPVIRHLSSSATGAVFTFGIQGGNIQPWAVSFNADGTVTRTGWEKPTNTHLAEPANALNTLLNLASNEGFFSMPATTSCAGTLPDIASRYIMIDTGSTSKAVKVHGTCVQGFNELSAVLENVADFQR
jgi:hypothetical protein